MPGLFQGLEIGKRALLTHQLSLQTIGHNIANVDTPGFTRQRVTIGASYPESNALGTIGTGVQAEDIRQIRDLFLGKQYREDNKSLGQWSYKDKIMTQIESLIAEPNDNTLSDLLNKFWDSWSDLATDPNSVSGRTAILEQANLLVNAFHETASQLDSLQSSIDRDLVNMSTEINRLSKEIARVTQQIKGVEIGGVTANDLRDQRDLLIDQLSTYVDVNTTDRANGGMQVSIGAMTLVDDADYIEITPEIINADGKVAHELRWQGSAIKLTNINGQLKGLLDSRDKTIPDYMAQLDAMAKAVIESVNTVHRSGYGLDGTTGNNFFDTTFLTAANMAVNADIVNEPSKIAASLSGEEGDNRIALAIHDLRDQATVGTSTTSITDFYNSMVGRLGVETREAGSFTDNYELLLNQVEQARQSVQGVSLDEEMTNMVKSQHAYDAAARVITAMDQALDTVINNMGVVGR